MHKQLSFGTKKKPSLQLNSGQLLQEAPTELQQDSGVYDAACPHYIALKFLLQIFKYSLCPSSLLPSMEMKEKKL